MKSGIATVVKNTGSHYLLCELPEWNPFPAVLKGKLRLSGNNSTNPVAVGDSVRFENDGTSDTASITEVLDRKNHIVRKSVNLSHREHVIAANIDLAVIVQTLYFPDFKMPFLDRILVTCGVYGVTAAIVFNKVDLYRDEASEELAFYKSVYEKAGYRVLETSAVTGEGTDELRGLCAGKTCLFSGESGVGKSSLISAMDSSLTPRVGEISGTHLQGMHTTSLSEMYPLSFGGYVIDTPGIRGFGLVRLEKEEIYKYFPEMLRESENCRFTPCTHTHEPGCGVKLAVDQGRISAERYNSYLGMLEEDQKFR